MKAERLDHLHIFVNDLEKAIDFFEHALGTKFSEVIAVEELAIRSVISPLGIELIAPTSPNSVVAKAIASRGEGLAGLTVKVPNIEEAVKHLKGQGLRQVGSTELGKIKEAQFHPKDAYGVMIELCEYEDQHGAVTAILQKK